MRARAHLHPHLLPRTFLRYNIYIYILLDTRIHTGKHTGHFDDLSLSKRATFLQRLLVRFLEYLHALLFLICSSIQSRSSITLRKHTWKVHHHVEGNEVIKDLRVDRYSSIKLGRASFSLNYRGIYPRTRKMQYKVAGYKDTYTYKSKTDIDRFFFLFFLFLSIRRAVPKTKISHKDAHDPVAPRNWVILRPQQKTSFRFLPKKLLFACLSRNFLDNDPSFSPSFSSFSFDRFGIRNTRRGKKEETHVGRSFKNGGSTFVSIPFL